MSEDGTILDRMFGALSLGDVQGTVDCYTADARVWHGFDCAAHDMTAMRVEWQALIDNFTERQLRRRAPPAVAQRIRSATPDGCDHALGPAQGLAVLASSCGSKVDGSRGSTNTSTGPAPSNRRQRERSLRRGCRRGRCDGGCSGLKALTGAISAKTTRSAG
jgi:hypothetical protein